MVIIFVGQEHTPFSVVPASLLCGSGCARGCMYVWRGGARLQGFPCLRVCDEQLVYSTYSERLGWNRKCKGEERGEGRVAKGDRSRREDTTCGENVDGCALMASLANTALVVGIITYSLPS